jgi:hypothetical protein
MEVSKLCLAALNLWSIYDRIHSYMGRKETCVEFSTREGVTIQVNASQGSAVVPNRKQTLARYIRACDIQHLYVGTAVYRRRDLPVADLAVERQVHFHQQRAALRQDDTAAERNLALHGTNVRSLGQWRATASIADPTPLQSDTDSSSSSGQPAATAASPT